MEFTAYRIEHFGWSVNWGDLSLDNLFLFEAVNNPFKNIITVPQETR